MRSKYWIVLFLLLVVSAYLVMNGRKGPENHDVEAQNVKSDTVVKKQIKPLPTEALSSPEKNNQAPANPKDNKEGIMDELDAWMSYLQHRRYSEDTSVEITSLAMEYESCGNNHSQWLFQNMEPTEKQRQIKIAMDNHCKQLLNDYPLLADTQKSAEVEMVYAQFPASTDLGHFMQNNILNAGVRPDTLEFSRGLLPLALKAGNAQLLNMADWMSRFSLKNRLFDEQVIQGQNQDYLKTIQTIALTALSCDFQNGITCSPSASFMRDKCFTDDKFCGLDFNQWYERAVTPGMDADIRLLKQHFQNQVPE